MFSDMYHMPVFRFNPSPGVRLLSLKSCRDDELALLASAVRVQGKRGV